MMRPGRLAAALLVGCGLAAASPPAARAQVPAPASAQAPAYVVAEVEVTDPATFARYAAQVQATLAPFGGRYLVRGGAIEALEGGPPKTFVVLTFDSAQQARDWYGSSAYRAIQPLRVQATTAGSRLFIATGMPAR